MCRCVPLQSRWISRCCGTMLCQAAELLGAQMTGCRRIAKLRLGIEISYKGVISNVKPPYISNQPGMFGILATMVLEYSSSSTPNPQPPSQRLVMLAPSAICAQSLSYHTPYPTLPYLITLRHSHVRINGCRKRRKSPTAQQRRLRARLKRQCAPGDTARGHRIRQVALRPVALNATLRPAVHGADEHEVLRGAV